MNNFSLFILSLFFASVLFGQKEELQYYKDIPSFNEDKEIKIKIMDYDNNKPIAFAKLLMVGTDTSFNFFGVSNEKGIIDKKFPEGEYTIHLMIDGYDNSPKNKIVDNSNNVLLIFAQKSKPAESIIPTEKEKPVIPEKSIKSATPQEQVATKNPEKPKEITFVDAPAIRNQTDGIPSSAKKNATLSPKKFPVLKKEIVKTYRPEPKKIKDTNQYLFDVVLLIDRSFSMSKEYRIGLLKAGIKHLVNFSPNIKKIGLVSFNDKLTTELPLTYNSESRKSQIMATIDSIKTEGTTNGILGISECYELFDTNELVSHKKMIILATDGVFFHSSDEEKKLYQFIEQKEKEGYLFSTLGFGSAEQNNLKLNKMAILGNGFFIKVVPSMIETPDFLGNEFLSYRLYEHNQ